MQPAIARKVGEGQDRPDAQEVLDVRTDVLVQWLASRSMLPADWAQRLAAIQAKAKECMRDVQPDVLHALGLQPSSSPDYWAAVAIRDALAPKVGMQGCSCRCCAATHARTCTRSERHALCCVRAGP